MAISSDIKYPTVAELRQQFIDDVELRAIDTGVTNPQIQAGSHWDLLATACANQVSLGLEKVQILDSDANELTADGEPLREAMLRNGLEISQPAPGSGKIAVYVSGYSNVPPGTVFQAAGMKGHFTLGAVHVTGTVQVDAIMDATGTKTNLPVGTKVKLVNQPPNVAVEATVAVAFTGGTGTESPDRQRERLRIKRSSVPGGGNWGQIYTEAMAASGSVSHCGVYPCLGGPGSTKVVLATDTTPGTRVASSAVIAAVTARLSSKFPRENQNIVVQSVANKLTDVALGLRLPTSGSGIWLASGPNSPAVISAISSPTSFTISPIPGTGTASGIIPGDTIAFFSTSTRSISKATVESVVSTTSPYYTHQVVTGAWSGGGTPTSGDWIFPTCEGLDDILAVWLTEMVKLGPGENVLRTHPRYARAYRRPDATQGSAMELTARQTGTLQSQIPNVISAQYLYCTAYTTAPPAAVSGQVEILCQNRFAVYPI